MKVLVACEESQEVCKAFRALGHEAYSCDIQEPSGGHPEWHILGDALKAIEGGQVTTMDGETHDVGMWDLLIAHPPCTYLTVAGAANIPKNPERIQQGEEAAAFLWRFITAKFPELRLKTLFPCADLGCPRIHRLSALICLAIIMASRFVYGLKISRFYLQLILYRVIRN